MELGELLPEFGVLVLDEGVCEVFWVGSFRKGFFHKENIILLYKKAKGIL